VATLRYFPLGQAVTVPTSHWDGGLAVDLFAPDGTPVVAVFDGYALAGVFPNGGNAVMLTATDGSMAAYYAHLRSSAFSGPVSAGQVIGAEGHSGNADKGNGAADSHLHFALASSTAVFEETNGAGDIAPWLVLPGLPIAGADAAPGPATGGGLSGLTILVAAVAALYLVTEL
jgi:murein DD-endopeptidase MepM/ murein hydrolase activator NlpD